MKDVTWEEESGWPHQQTGHISIAIEFELLKWPLRKWDSLVVLEVLHCGLKRPTMKSQMLLTEPWGIPSHIPYYVWKVSWGGWRINPNTPWAKLYPASHLGWVCDDGTCLLQMTKPSTASCDARPVSPQSAFGNIYLAPPLPQLKVFYQHFANVVSDEGQKTKRITQKPGLIVHILILSLGLFFPFQLLFKDLELLTWGSRLQWVGT